MTILNSLIGMVRVRITSASIDRVLILLNERGVKLQNVCNCNGLTVDVQLLRTKLGVLNKIATSLNAEVSVLERSGFFWSAFSLLNRPVLLAGVLAYIFLVMFLPTRILFVRIEGNQVIPDRLILKEAQEVGIRFGALRRDIKSEKAKNELLGKIPELKWAGVNTKGCVAVIQVKERSHVTQPEDPTGVRSIVAKCDGVIDEIVHKKGNVLCQVGQAVAKNQVLISGYTDCGISMKATSADAEVYARTLHDEQLITPVSYTGRTNFKEKSHRFRLIFGKKCINLYKDSGISDVKCVKIKKTSYLTLPGGFALPLGMVKETLIFYDIADKIADKDILHSRMWDLGCRYLNEYMVAGKILAISATVQQSNDAYILKCRYFCREMIGKVFNEEIVTRNE